MEPGLLQAYRDGIGFYSLGSRFSYISLCLADGLAQLGIPIHSNIAYQNVGICNFSFNRSDSSVLSHSKVVVTDLEDLNEQTALCLPSFERQVFLAMNDNLSDITPPRDIPFFCTHENRFHKLPGMRIPWAFGPSSRMIDQLRPDGSERLHRFIANFRPTYSQTVRQALDLCLVDRLRRIHTVDTELSDPERWGDQHFKKLRSSIGCLAYGGYFAQNLHKTPYLAERLPPSPAVFNRDTVVLRWDSWRFWESLVAGCATAHLNFEKYGFVLPVMPVSGRDYIGIDLEDITETITLLSGTPQQLSRVGEQGRQWALTHYSPIAVARRFLQHICIIEQQRIPEQTLPDKRLSELQKNPLIVIDAVFFQYRVTGIARVWEEILRQWAKMPIAEHLIILDRDGSCPRIEELCYRTINRHDYNRLDSDQQMLQQICDEEEATCFVSTYYSTPLTTPSLLLIHDCIPEALGADLREPSWQEKRHAIEYASRFCTVSTHTTQDLLHFYPETANRPIQTILNGVSEFFTPAAPDQILLFCQQVGITKPYYFFVGPVEWYKNFTLLIEAFNQLPNKNDYLIVRTRSEDGNSPAMPGVITTGRLSDEQLRTAYSGALALVYPSWYEGFGLPVLEAMACGCPVIAANASSIPEVAGDAACLIPPHDQNAMVAALLAMQEPETRQNLRQRGLERVLQFSWKRTAKELLSAITSYGSQT